MNLKGNVIINFVSNIPNLLSIARILLVPVLVYYIGQEDSTLEIIIYTGLIFITDFFDGFLARKLNVVTEMGKILDPIADKICVVGVGVAIVLFRDFPIWAVIVLASRDLLILLYSSFVVKKQKVIPVSNYVGKVAVGIFGVMFYAYIFHWNFLKLPLLYTSMVLVVLSLYLYHRRYSIGITQNAPKLKSR